ncbi:MULTISPECIES: DUF2969 domain-containing protein [Streptococcus]|uniref:DUF2969 domain-containing protein n=1 Tax=Streptococcus caledonicus TaxID=2614158 RepID=A0ABW0UG40_9STRE|nr:DUF2969 domain-containing protein [Streptococcus sp. S784/96/1]
MSKKDKKIEIQIVDAKIEVNGTEVDGYQLNIAKKMIGEIAELDDRFALVKDSKVDRFYKTLDQAVEKIIENYNLNH